MRIPVFSASCGCQHFAHETTPEQYGSRNNQIATLETCVLPDGTEKRGAEVTFGESAEGGIRCEGCVGKG